MNAPRTSLTGAARVAGVAGWPVAHSLSPALMSAWIEAAGLDAAYVPFPVRPESAERAFRALPALGLAGLNVTAPLKQIALQCAEAVEEEAKIIGAANVLTVTDKGLRAANTDAAGFLAALAEAGVDPAAGPALVLGAGGAARALVFALVRAGAPEIRIANRGADRAAALARDLAPKAEIVDWAARDAALAGAALTVNATSLAPAMDWTRTAPGAAVFDAIYRPLHTPFLKAAAARGLKTIDGLGMLIGQARPAFESFYGAPPPDIDARALLAPLAETAP